MMISIQGVAENEEILNFIRVRTPAFSLVVIFFLSCYFTTGSCKCRDLPGAMSDTGYQQIWFVPLPKSHFS